MKRLLALFLFPLSIMSDDSINLLCEYIEDSEIRYENMSRTQFFTNASFTIKVYPKDRYAIFNEDSWKYFSQTDGLKITITTRVISGSTQDIGKLFNYYDWIEIDRETGSLFIKNYTKQNESDDDESYPLAFSKQYQCRSLKLKF